MTTVEKLFPQKCGRTASELLFSLSIMYEKRRQTSINRSIDSDYGKRTDIE